MPVLAVVLILAIGFPYVQPLPSDSYTQIYAVVTAALIVVLTGARGLMTAPALDRLALMGLAAAGLVAFALSSFPQFGNQELKYLLNYLSPLIIAPAVMTLALEQRRSLDIALRFSAAAWILVALCQTLIEPTFGTALLGSWGEFVGDISASGRGVVGLAPEPTHHAFHMIGLAAALALIGRPAWAVLCLASAILLARSASGLMVLSLGLALAVLFSGRIRLILSGLAGAVAAYLLLLLVPAGSGGRIVILARRFLEDPLSILTADLSVNMRLGGMLSTLLWQASQLFVPHGLMQSAWLVARQDILLNYPWVVDLSETGPPTGWGMVSFQLGVLSFPLIAAFMWRLSQAPRTPIARWAVVSVPIIYLFQYYISAPQFSLVYGLCMASTFWATSSIAPPASLLQQDWARLMLLSGQPGKRLRFWHMLSPRFMPIALMRGASHAHEGNRKILAKFFSLLNFLIFNLEVPARLKIGPGLVLPHPQGTVLGAAKIGSNVTIFHQVTLGARAADFAFDPATRPVVGDEVTLSTGAKILGPIIVGDGATVGANAVVLKDVPPGTTAVGIPARIIDEAISAPG